MRFEHIVYAGVVAIGAAFAWGLLHSRWPGWKGCPLLLLVLQATNDLGIAPLVSDLSGVEYKAIKLITRTHGTEALRAAGLLSVSYFVIAAGLISIRFLSGRQADDDVVQIREEWSRHLAVRGWGASLLFFALGVAANLLILSILLRQRGIGLVVAERALYADEGFVESPVYYMLLMLGHSMLIGALGMILFSGRSLVRLRVGIAATFVTIGMTSLYGGRRGVVAAIVCFLLVYKYAVGRIRVRRLACFVLIFLLLFGALVYARFGHLLSRGLADVGIFSVLRLSLVGYCRVDDAAWILRTVPDKMPYTGVLNAAGVVGRFVPGMVIPGTDTLYGYVIQRFYGGENPYGGTIGANYAAGAELYSWGGWPSVLIFGYMIGLFFGMIFEWQRRCRRNPFLVLLTVLISVQVFFPGVQARMPYLMSRVGVYVIFVAALAVLAVPSRRAMPFLLLLGWSLVPVVIWKVFDLDFLRVFILCLSPLAYLLAVQSLRIVGTYFIRREHPRPVSEPLL
ncbi:MAG: oligosaccharide repeat unit polymerase [Phycisphaerae bacterium]|nr:oligosaccharide repeat unit polymerase [Phycisphaerae bacterium]